MLPKLRKTARTIGENMVAWGCLGVHRTGAGLNLKDLPSMTDSMSSARISLDRAGPIGHPLQTSHLSSNAASYLSAVVHPRLHGETRLQVQGRVSAKFECLISLTLLPLVEHPRLRGETRFSRAPSAKFGCLLSANRPQATFSRASFSSLRPPTFLRSFSANISLGWCHHQSECVGLAAYTFCSFLFLYNCNKGLD